MYNVFFRKMRRLLMILLLVPALLHAQSDNKYMAGAVPEVNGKVVFTRSLNVPDFSKEQIYKAMLDWGNQTFSGGSARMLYGDADKGIIVFQGEEVMTIKIGLFPGKVRALYMLTANCADGRCELETSRIKYKNNPSSKSSEDIITAEEYITDKYALNKAKTKIFRGTGDYRSKTIDLVDKIATDAQNAVYSCNGGATTQLAANAATSVAQPAQMQQQTTQQTSADKQTISISDNFIQAIAKRGLSVIAVNGHKLDTPITGKGAVDLSSDKAAVIFTLESNAGNTSLILEMAESYTLALLDETNSQSLLILECKKTQQFNNMFVGEIKEAKAN